MNGPPAPGPELIRVRFEQAVRIVGKRDADALQLEPLPRLERNLEMRLDFDLHVFCVPAQVDDTSREPAL